MEEEEGGALARFVDDADDVGLPAFFLLTSVEEELDEEVDELVRLLEDVSLLRPIAKSRSLFVPIDLFVFVYFIPLFFFSSRLRKKAGLNFFLCVALSLFLAGTH